jgi:hypothetical protein
MEARMKVSGALAWHPQVEMTKEEIDDFLSGRWIARLATIGRDGYPHVTPLWYYWEGKCLYPALTRNRFLENLDFRAQSGSQRCFAQMPGAAHAQ